MVFSELQTIALEAALEASIAILEVYHQDFSARIKNDGSPVTKADLISSKLILDKLKHTRLPIINEETPKETYDKIDYTNKLRSTSIMKNKDFLYELKKKRIT